MIKYLKLPFFLIFFVLTLSFQSFTKADDIRDFEIEGIRIGDSALDFYSEDTIISSMKQQPYDDDKFYEVEFSNEEGTYKIIGLVFKKSDNKYIIYSIKGMNFIEFGKCIKEKKSIIKDIKKDIKSTDEKNYRANFKNKFGNSYAMVTDLVVKGGSIRVWCDNFDKSHEEAKHWEDAISIDLSTEEFLFWLSNKAFN